MNESDRKPGPASSIAEGSTIGDVLTRPPLDPFEARILVAHVLRMTRVQLITQSDRILNASEAERIASVFNRRMAGEPIAYLVGEREFYGLMLEVTPDVLIPRPETELLVELALARLPPRGRVLDLGTGSGAIAIALAHSRPDASVTAVDVSECALAVARKNASRHGASVNLQRSDWYEALGSERFDLIVANPPYIVAGDPHLAQGDLRFEPVDALTDHGDGLSALRAIAAGATARLVPAGWLLMEHGYHQADSVRELLRANGMRSPQSWTDLAGIERVTGAMH